ncbi:MAG: hypothetical protein CVU39_09295 [Chloroflexi bacterium HGW-Chloroflexi-10]|nr:MAG: hypothetical protein CVU39_09295 [Chloroflexi bacterium HGW-Chloroflexi-10]
MKQNIVVKLVLVVALCLAGILYLIFLLGSTFEAVVFPQSPQKVTLAQAVEMDLQNKPAFLVFDQALYISITDAMWECASVKQTGYKVLSDRRYTDAVFTDAKKTAVVFVQVNGFYSCQDLKENEISGELHRLHIDTRPVEYQSDTNGITIIDEDSQVLAYRFCTHCTPSAAGFIPIFWLLIPFIIWRLSEHWKKS